MVKTDSAKRRKRQSKVVPKKAVEEEDNVETEGPMETASSNEQAVEKEEEAASTDTTEVKQHEDVNHNKQDSQVDAVIEVKGSKSSVTVSWDNKEGDPKDNKDIKEKTNGGEQVTIKKTAVKGKRKAQSTATTSPSKKTKHNSDGFCVFVGNLNTSKKFVELKDALGNYLMAQSLLVQDIRLDRSKKHAHIDLASEMDLTAALKLNGELVLDKPIKVEKAKIRSEDDVKVKASAQEKKAMKDARCLFLKNLPFNATKEDIMKIFKKAVDVRFPGGSAGPTKGIAFLEFKNRTIARKVQKKKQVVEIQDRVLIVDFVGEARSKVTKVNDKDKKEAPPNDTLFVSNLSHNINKQKLKKLFQKAVSINIPQINGKPRGFAFIKFATVADAEKAFGSSQSIKLGKREVRVLFCETKEKPVLLNTLIVMGLAEKTSAETLKNAFEGALSTRIITDKDTGVSKGYGFVDFESEEKCKAVKDDMEDCEIDGSKVTVAFAKQKVEKSPPGAIKSLEVPAPAQPADQKAVRGRRGSQGGKGRRAGKPKDAVKKVGNKG